MVAESGSGAGAEPKLTREQVGIQGRRKILERTSVIDAIVAEIKDKIISGDLKDGDMLASQDELARAMGVSRASLREALNRLSLMGLIETRQGTGTFVKTAEPVDFLNSLSSLLILDRASAMELLDARYYVESACAELAARNATDEEIKEMSSLLDRMERVGSFDAETFAVHDLRFHTLVAQSSRNRVLVKVLGIISDILRQFILGTVTAHPVAATMATTFHRNVFEAIRHHDPAAARKHMEEHIRYLIELNAQEAQQSDAKTDD